MKKTLSDLESEIEHYRFELAEELGIIERTDSGKKSRVGIIKCRPPFHKHIIKKMKGRSSP